MKQKEFYCVKCKKVASVNNHEIRLRTLKNDKHCLFSHCDKCNTKLFKFVKEDDVEKLSSKYKKCSTRCPSTSLKKSSKKSGKKSGKK
jgi:hypothetical protein